MTAAPVGVMVGHLQVPELTGDEPASVNRAAVQLLRTGTGYHAPAFDGPVFSDDLSSMAAIKDRYSVPDAVLQDVAGGHRRRAVGDHRRGARGAGPVGEGRRRRRVDGCRRRHIGAADQEVQGRQVRLRTVIGRCDLELLSLDEGRGPLGGDSMAGGTKRLPRAVREQQMLDAAVEMFSINGYHDTSMDAIAAKAEISKPMLYLYYGSKEELFGACLDRELARFIDGVREEINLDQSPRDLLHNTIVAFMRYIDSNRASWIVMYAQATNSQAFAHTVREGRERIIALVVRVLQAGTRNPEPDSDFEMIAAALVGAGEAIATRLSTGDTDVDGAADVMINLFWRGLKGKPTDKDAAEPVADSG